MRDIKNESRRTFDAQAEQYDQSRHGEHARHAYPVILEMLRKATPEKILDLGCGTGALLAQVMELNHVEAAYGLDLSVKMLAQAKHNIRGATLVQGDAEHLPFEDCIFDAVYCNDSFHHYPNPKAVLAEVRRVLKQGGLFILCDPYQEQGTLWITNFILRLTNTGHVSLYSKTELCSMMSDYFSGVVWHKVGYTAHLVSGVKR